MSDERSKIIRQAFLESLAVLGAQASHALIEDLRRYGVFIYDQNISLERLASALRELAGEEAARLLLERVYVKLDELCGSRRHYGS